MRFSRSASTDKSNSRATFPGLTALERSYGSCSVLIDLKEGVKAQGLDNPRDLSLGIEQFDVFGLVHAFFLFFVQQVCDGVDCPKTGAAHVLHLTKIQQNVVGASLD